MPANRDSAGRFVKGKSGNPSGRPRVPGNVKEALRELVPEAIEVKRQILQSEESSMELKNKVADSVLDRVYGRPAQLLTERDGGELDKLDKLIEGIGHEAES